MASKTSVSVYLRSGSISSLETQVQLVEARQSKNPAKISASKSLQEQAKEFLRTFVAPQWAQVHKKNQKPKLTKMPFRSHKTVNKQQIDII